MREKCLLTLKKKLVGILGLMFCLSTLFAENDALDLVIEQGDIRLEKDSEAGYHLYIRKKPNINSVILVETTKDPTGQEANYAYRAENYNPINGDEKRILNGEFLNSEYAKYSLIDSTPEKDSKFGEAFHIYIPEELSYGYPWTRNGKIPVEKGTFINIRSFEKPYADYTGSFADNPFMFNFEIKQIKTENPPVVEKKIILTDSYNPTATYAFDNIAKENGGKLIYSSGPESIIADIMESFNAINPKDKIDVVFCIDATGSMKDDIDILRAKLIPELREAAKQCGSIRYGLVLYRDYVDSFRFNGLPIKVFEFTSDLEKFVSQLNSFSINGREGGDIPEAVYEALYGAISYFDWASDSQKKVILIGDAEPHAKPRGTTVKCTFDLVNDLATKKNILIDTIITPDNVTDRRK
ncbi:MAG: VWA domain-containing protein [Spirochaetaceae bacterium]|nr:VWA domain-containing protein [Spirochaetaceae bacterium]